MDTKGQSTPTKGEYDDLIYRKSSSDRKRKYKKDRKLSEGILKSSFHKKNKLKNKDEANNVKFDIKSIEEQNDYRKDHPKLDKEKIKEASTKYKVIEEAENDDEYIKTLTKVNNMKTTDEIITKVIEGLSKLDVSPKKTKRHYSCENIKNNCKLNIEKLYSLTGNEKLFNKLEDEQKITLQNTLLNKFYKIVKESEDKIK